MSRIVVVFLALLAVCPAPRPAAAQATSAEPASPVTGDLAGEARLLLDQGRRLANAGRQADAVPFYRRALDYLAVVHGTRSSELARHEIELGRVLRDAGRPAAARALLESLAQRLRSTQDRDLLATAQKDLETLRRPPPPPPAASAPPPPAGPQDRDGTIFRAQLLARQSRADAEREAERLRSAYPHILRGLPSHLETVDLGERGVWHRVQFGAFSTREAAQRICDRLEPAGWGDCLVARVDSRLD